MAAAIISVETGLQIVSQLLTLLQNSASSGQPIDAATWANALNARDSALVKLDADIKKLVDAAGAAKAAGK